MKVGVLTFHRALNYGAVLQTYALVSKLKQLGHDAEVIDYRAPFNEERFKPTPILTYLEPRKFYHLLFSNAYQRFVPDTFRDFVAKCIPSSSVVANDKSALSQIVQDYDAVVAGSDQIWNLSCTVGDDSYFLPFPKRAGQLKVAYAASIGKISLSDSEQKLIKVLVNDFDSVSCRESHGARLIEQICSRTCETVLDPTLLLSPQEWSAISDFSLVPNRKYLLIYVMSEDMGLLKLAKKYAKLNGLSVIYITWRLLHRLRNVTYLKNVSPEQWIGLFLNADTIATNSFHGTAFGINFGKKLFVKRIPKSVANSRLDNIMDIIQCREKMIDDSCNIETPIEINNNIKAIIDRQRSDSIDYLKKAL